MENENPIRTLGDYSKPSHEDYRNTTELRVGNNVVPLGSDTIQLVQNECSFHRLRFEDSNKHLKDYLKLMDSLDLDVANRERTRMTAKLCNDILMFQHIKESLFLKHGLISRTYSKKSFIMASTFGSKSKYFMIVSILSQDEPSINRPVAISLPQDVSSTSDRRLIELENQVQRLMEAHLDPKQSVVNKITSLCKICSDPHDTQYCMENLEQAFVDYASSRTKEVGGNSINAITICPKLPNKFGDDKSEEEEREEKSNPENINTTPPSPPDPSISFITEKVRKLNSFLESSGLVPRSSNTKFICKEEDDGDVENKGVEELSYESTDS
ncbi:hypothetical protein Tco_0602352 [Tanacetum coccineum]